MRPVPLHPGSTDAIECQLPAGGPRLSCGRLLAPILGVSLFLCSLVGGANNVSASPQAAAAPATPPPPTNLVANARDGKVELTWSLSAGGARYVIKRSRQAAGPFNSVGTSSGGAFLDSGLANGTAYFYVVTAKNAGGQESGSSNQASATPKAAVRPKKKRRNFIDFVSIINGFVLLTPYRIEKTAAGPPPTFQMETAAETEVRYFIEAELSFRDAWADRVDKEPILTKCLGKSTKDVLNWLGPVKLFPDDYDFQIGYVAGTSDEASGATLLGSGEGFAEIQVGWNFGGVHKIERTQPDHDIRVTLNTELIYGAVSDRNAQKVHEYWKVGLAGVWDIPIDDEENSISAIAGIYVGKTDVPKLAATPGVAEVQTDHGFPRFEKKKVVSLRGEINVPLQIGTVFIAGEFETISGSDFSSEPWEISMGIAIPLSRVAALFGYEN